jgi:hypothetical protein
MAALIFISLLNAASAVRVVMYLTEMFLSSNLNQK